MCIRDSIFVVRWRFVFARTCLSTRNKLGFAVGVTVAVGFLWNRDRIAVGFICIVGQVLTTVAGGSAAISWAHDSVWAERFRV